MNTHGHSIRFIQYSHGGKYYTTWFLSINIKRTPQGSPPLEFFFSNVSLRTIIFVNFSCKCLECKRALILQTICNFLDLGISTFSRLIKKEIFCNILSLKLLLFSLFSLYILLAWFLIRPLQNLIFSILSPWTIII